MTFSWHRGHEMASLQVPETDVDDEDEEQERTDAALVKHDVIKVINRFIDSFQFNCCGCRFILINKSFL